MKVFEKIAKLFGKQPESVSQKVEVDLNYIDTCVKKDSIFGELHMDEAIKDKNVKQTQAESSAE